MTTYDTGNPLGSTSAKDLFDNAQNLDIAVNSEELTWLDRGPSGIHRTRKTYAGIEFDARTAIELTGYIYTTPLAYQAGIVITLPNQIFLKDGEYYKPAPALTLPYTTTGVWATEQALFTPIGDATLRAALIAPGGVALVNGAEQTVDSVAALQALPTTSSIQYAKTLAYYVGGQGAADYWYDPTFPHASANGGTSIISLTGGGCWRMLPRATVTLFHFGAKGDDVSDDTAAIQAAATWSQASGASVTVQAVTAAYRTTAPINAVSPNFIGEGCVMTTGGGANVHPRGNGSWFHFDHAGRGFNCNAASLNAGYPRFEKIGTIRNQPTPNGAAPWSPTANDYDFYLWNCDATLTDFVTLNPTKGIFVSADPASSQSRTTINGWRGQPLQIGINVEFSADIVRTSNVHLWPYWSIAQGVYNYMLVQAAAYLSGRNDNPMLESFFTIYYGYGISIYQTAQGTTNKMAGTNVDIDGSGVAWLYAGPGVTGFSCKFSNCDAQGVTVTTSLYGVYLDTTSSGCTVVLSNCAMGVYMDSAIHNLGVNNVVRMVATTLFSWNGANGAFPAISLGANSVLEYDTTCLFTSPANAAADFSVAGIVKGIGKWTTHSGATDASGNLIISHNFGHTPTGALTSASNAGVGLIISPVSYTASAVTFNVRTSNTGAVLASSAIAFPYMIFF